MADDVEATVRGIVEDYAEPTDDAAALEIDSLSLVQLVEDLEDAFGFVVSEKDLDADHFANVASIVAFVRSRAK